MERERLTQLLRTPDRVAREDLADLRSLVARYPWFSGAQVLQASGEGFAGDVRSDETLNNAAAHVPSRAVLFDIAKSSEDSLLPKSVTPIEKPVVAASEMPPEDRAPASSLFAEPVVAAPEVGVPKVALPSTGNSDGFISPKAEVEVPEAAMVENAVPVAPVEPPSAEHSEIAIAPGLMNERPAALPEVNISDPLERQILEAALASAYDLTLHHPVPRAVETVFEKEQELPVTAAPPLSSVVLEEKRSEPSGIEPSADEVHAVIPKETTDVPRTRKRFSSWLNAVSEVGPAPNAKPAPIVMASTITPAAASPAATPDNSAAAPSVEERKSIVDRFIEQEIQPVATKKEFFTPQQAAKRSLDDTVGLVTETLASIYAKQGNIPKAKDAYRKLALKYPEKSAYFAGLLQSLEAQQNK